MYIAAWGDLRSKVFEDKFTKLRNFVFVEAGFNGFSLIFFATVSAGLGINKNM